MKKTGMFLLVLACCGLGAIEARATWWIDAGELHTSAHMDLSCQDCHEDIVEQDLHPDPADVTRGVKDFFSEEKCSTCHGDVVEDLDEEVHGTREVRDRQEYAL